MSVIIQGKKKREELQLPVMHFVVADDWLDKLGYETFGIWMKLHTWVDRTDVLRDYDRIPMSLEKCWEKLNVSKSKFYRLIKPLWEYGLIDIVEYEESNRKSQKPKNIIIYEYPLHDVVKKYQPLEKLRDWTSDYDSISKVCGMTGGRPRNQKKKNKKYRLIRDTKKYRFKIKTVDGFKIKTVDGFKNETVTVSKLKPNNVSNKSINVSNLSNNDSNTLLTDDDRILKNDNGMTIKKSLIFNELDAKEAFSFVNSFTIASLTEDFNLDRSFIKRTVCYLWKAGLRVVYSHEFKEQFKKIWEYEQTVKGKANPIRDKSLYLVNGIVMNRTSLNNAKDQKKLKRSIKEQERLKEVEKENDIKIPFFNWLGSN